GGGVAVGARKVELKVGDVLIVPPGVIHGWFDIPDHVDYLSFRPSHGIMKNGWINPTIAPKWRVQRSIPGDRVCERPSRSVPSTLGPLHRVCSAHASPTGIDFLVMEYLEGGHSRMAVS